MLLKRALRLRVKILVSKRVVAPTPIVSSISMSNVEKLGKFCRGAHFKRWHQEMMFYLTIMNLVGCLTEEAPVVAENKTNN